MSASPDSAMLPSFANLDDPESLRELVRHLSEGIYITNEEGAILDANPALLQMVGVASLEELRSLKAGALLADPSARRRELELLRRDGFVRDFELTLKCSNGESRTVLDSAYRCQDPRTGAVLYRGILIDITDRKHLEEQLVEQSVRDPLTGCYNRRWLPQFEAAAEQSGWGCIAVDVDHFKDFNDQYGHDAGDEVLIKIARLLSRQVRAEEGVVRMGGDEFVILLQGGDAESTEAAARRLRGAGSQESPIPFSIGWACRREGERLEKTLTRADRDMFAIRLHERPPEHDRRRR